MKAFVPVACYILSVALVTSSCTRGDSEINDPRRDSTGNNALHATVLKRESKWAVLSWNNVQSLAPNQQVKYKIYINGSLRKADITGTSDTIKNISFDTTYSGYLYAYTPTKQLAGIDFNLERLQFEKERLVGTWNATFAYGFDYKQRIFNADSSYIQDMSNWGFGLSTGKWWWGNEDSVYMLITAGSAAYPSPSVIKVLNLTPDSLKIRFGTEIKSYYK